MVLLEWITCDRCGVQQPRKRFHYNGQWLKTCISCNGKSNVLPPKNEHTARQILTHLQVLVKDNMNSIPVPFQLQLGVVYQFLAKQADRKDEIELKKTSIGKRFKKDDILRQIIEDYPIKEDYHKMDILRMMQILLNKVGVIEPGKDDFGR